MYLVANLGGLGGTASAGSSVNDQGLIAGFATDPGDGTMQAAVWRAGESQAHGLGTLGGANRAVLWPVKNNGGLVVGIAETDEVSQYNEAWSCSAFFPGSPTHHVCLGFAWRDNVMTRLATLGGDNGFATGANDHGQVVGWSEIADADPTCNLPQVLGFRATVWDLNLGTVRQLPPLPGDTASAATAINDRGDVVGISGICDNAVGRFSARHAVLWRDGLATDLGSFGGVSWNTPMATNHDGTVVGFANPAGDTDGGFRARPFVWTRGGGFQPLDLLSGDTTGQALGINGRGQIVGLSCGASGCRAVLWENGAVADLNSLAAGYNGHLIYANDINDVGVITGQASSGGSLVAFRAVPARR
jgi:probable HAF family extracellular repeat protein